MEESIYFITEDKIKLSGTLFLSKTAKAVVQIKSATAVLKEFYLNYARYLQSQDFHVLIFDYRGIGESKPAEGLKGCTYNYTDWSRYDMAAAINFLKSKFADLPLLIMSHSVGGQMLGLIPNANQYVKGVVTVNTSSGYGGNMLFKYKLRNFYFFEIVRPILLSIYGYGRLKALGMMEDLPKNIYNQFRDWCSVPDYFFDPKYASSVPGIEGFKNIAYPIHVFTTTDDDIGTPKNLHNLWKHIRSHAFIKHHSLDPKAFGLKSIGHFNVFRKSNKDLIWPLISNTLNSLI